jgi:hypothetical protein
MQHTIPDVPRRVRPLSSHHMAYEMPYCKQYAASLAVHLHIIIPSRGEDHQTIATTQRTVRFIKRYKYYSHAVLERIQQCRKARTTYVSLYYPIILTRFNGFLPLLLPKASVSVWTPTTNPSIKYTF